MNAKVIIQRLVSRDDGTSGKLFVVGNDFTCDTYELPDRANVSRISCINPGFVVGKWTNHPEHGWCYQLFGMEGREDILIHPFNIAGSTDSGFQTQALGCVGLGFGVAIFKAGTALHVEGPNGLEVETLTRDQRGITNSKDAVAAFNKLMAQADFDLEIRAPKV